MKLVGQFWGVQSNSGMGKLKGEGRNAGCGAQGVQSKAEITDIHASKLYPTQGWGTVGSWGQALYSLSLSSYPQFTLPKVL